MNEEHNFLYAPVPVAILSDNSINNGSKLLLGEIISLSRKNGYCFAMNKHFVDRLNVSKNTISRWLTELEEQNYIERKNSYRFDSGIEIEKRTITVNWTKLKIMNDNIHKKEADLIPESDNDNPINDDNTPINDNSNPNDVTPIPNIGDSIPNNDDYFLENSVFPSVHPKGVSALGMGIPRIGDGVSLGLGIGIPRIGEEKNTINNSFNNTYNNTPHRPHGLSSIDDGVSSQELVDNQSKTLEQLQQLRNEAASEPKKIVESNYKGRLSTKEHLTYDEQRFIQIAEQYPNQTNIDEAIEIYKELANGDGFNVSTIVNAIGLDKRNSTTLSLKDFLLKHTA